MFPSLSFDVDAILAAAPDPLAFDPGPYGADEDDNDWQLEEPPSAEPAAGAGGPQAAAPRDEEGLDDGDFEEPATKTKTRKYRSRKEKGLADRNDGPPLRRACNFCTKRRRKCDGVLPVCGTCKARNG